MEFSFQKFILRVNVKTKKTDPMGSLTPLAIPEAEGSGRLNLVRRGVLLVQVGGHGVVVVLADVQVVVVQPGDGTLPGQVDLVLLRHV